MCHIKRDRCLPHPMCLRMRLRALLACVLWALAEGQICQVGYIMYAGVCYPCTEGYYCENGALAGCYPGRKYEVVGNPTCSQCSRGYYCLGGVKWGATQVACTAGSYCPPETATANPRCTPGYACYTAQTRTLCDPGYYCPEGASSMTPCTAGRSCPAGSTCDGPCPTACPAGTYSNKPGGVTGADCSTCPPGTWSPNTGVSVCPLAPVGYCSSNPSLAPYQCMAGQYCPAGSSCPGGSLVWLPDGSSAPNPSVACPAGYYCPNRFGAYPCTAGSYCPSGASSPVPCSAGQTCTAGSACNGPCPTTTSTTTPTPTTTSTTTPTPTTTPAPGCSRGYYMSGGNCVACPVGTYSNVLGATSNTTCVACPAGTYSDTPGANSVAGCVPCAPGTFRR